MFCLKLDDGDLSLGLDGRLETVRFEDKLVQQLKTWLLFPYGASPTAPAFGSVLNDFIGDLHPDQLQVNILDEVNRITGMYQQDQIERIRRDQGNGVLQNWSRREVLASTTNMNSMAAQDNVVVSGVLHTLAETQQSVEVFIGQGGAG